MGDQTEENKRKQRFLLRNGVNVKVDGSWGPWQQAQYSKLTTKEKPYQTTPLGLLSFTFDKLTGNSTYQEDPPEVKGYDGEIKSDNRSNTRRWVDQQMSNNRTPLGYVTQTVLPTGAVAAAVTYGAPVLYNAVTKGAPFIYNGIRTVASNPATIKPALQTGVQTGLRLGKQLGKELVKGVVGMRAVNMATKATTGKTWGEQVSQSTGVSPEFGEILNPGAALGLKAHNIFRRPLQVGRDLIWLARDYNNVGSGLTNPYVRNAFLDLAKHPSISRRFIETYSRSGDAGLSYSQIEEALPQLKNLQEEFNITPQMNFKNYETVAEQVKSLRNALQSAKNLSNRYTRELELLKDKNKVLYNIAKESPQYQQQIVSDLQNGNITNTEEYIKNLIKQSNTFLRRMNLKSGQDFTEAFSTIRGRSIGKEDFSMDVGNPEVVFDPIWSRGYGNNVAVYSPKEIKLNGPVETWWSQRKPRFQDKSIYIDTEGLHTGNQSNLYPSDIQYNVNKYIKSVGLPKSYNRTASHMIFLSPNEGASIADQFMITPGNPKNIRYTLGYKNGGAIPIGTQEQYNNVVSIYQSLVSKGVPPQAALEIVNQKVAEKGWAGFATGDNKKYFNADDFADHIIDWHGRMYPDSLKAKSFEDYWKGIQITPKYKYNSENPNYKQELLKTRSGVKKRINFYRQQQGLNPLAYIPTPDIENINTT